MKRKDEQEGRDRKGEAVGEEEQQQTVRHLMKHVSIQQTVTEETVTVSGLAGNSWSLGGEGGKGLRQCLLGGPLLGLQSQRLNCSWIFYFEKILGNYSPPSHVQIHKVFIFALFTLLYPQGHNILLSYHSPFPLSQA